MEYQHTEQSPSTSLAVVSHQPLAIGTAMPVHSDNSLSLTVLNGQPHKANTPHCQRDSFNQYQRLKSWWSG